MQAARQDDEIHETAPLMSSDVMTSPSILDPTFGWQASFDLPSWTIAPNEEEGVNADTLLSPPNRHRLEQNRHIEICSTHAYDREQVGLNFDGANDSGPEGYIIDEQPSPLSDGFRRLRHQQTHEDNCSMNQPMNVSNHSSFNFCEPRKPKQRNGSTCARLEYSVYNRLNDEYQLSSPDTSLQFSSAHISSEHRTKDCCKPRTSCSRKINNPSINKDDHESSFPENEDEQCKNNFLFTDTTLSVYPNPSLQSSPSLHNCDTHRSCLLGSVGNVASSDRHIIHEQCISENTSRAIVDFNTICPGNISTAHPEVRDQGLYAVRMLITCLMT